ncbi:MAG: hypothetical protein N2234_10375, partial [Planctomycetota bacterium]|nr:hypothetical protein [Planctomycetota bacterium]
MLKTVLDEGKIRRGIFYFILLYFLFSQWHRLFWKGCGEHLFGDPLNLLWIPALLYGILWILTKRLPLCTPKTTIESLFLVFVAFTALQFLWATNRTEHLSMFILVVQLYFAYWFTLSALSDEKSLEEFFIALMSIQSIQAFVVILISYFNADNYIIRTLLGAIGGSATYLGLSFYLSLSIALPTIASSTKPLLRILSTATVVLVPPALVGSTSRTPAIAGLFCFLITFPFLLKTAKNRLNLIAAYAVAILLSFLLYRAAFQQQPFLLPTEPGYQGYNLSKLSFIDISLGERVLIWAEAKRRWLEAPLLG